MQILIQNKEAVIKDGTEIELHFENPLFGEAETYSLAITFPMRGCPQNIAIFGRINRKDVAIGRVRLPCRIIHRAISFVGTLTITEVTDTDVKGQFLEGRSAWNFDDTLDSVQINTLNLGALGSSELRYHEDAAVANLNRTSDGFVIIPWGQANTGNIQNEFHIHPINHNYSNVMRYTKETMKMSLSACIFLYDLTESIIRALGFKPMLKEWKESHFYDLLVLNTIPGLWTPPAFPWLAQIKYVLPPWTAQKFFSQLELFLGGAFEVDYENKSINFHFNSTSTEHTDIVVIDSDIDSFSAMSSQEDESDCILSSNLRYSGGSDDTVFQEDSCDWLIESHKDDIDVYETYKEFADMARALPRRDYCFSKDSLLVSKYRQYDRIAYVKEYDTYFYIKVGCDWIVKGTYPKLRDLYQHHSAYIAKINTFGNRLGKELDNQPVTDLEIVPVSVSNDPNANWWTPIIAPVSLDENITGSEEGSSIYLDKNDAVQNTKFQKLLSEGEPAESISLYSKIYVGFWFGAGYHLFLNPDVSKGEVMCVLPPVTDWLLKTGPYSFRTLDKKYSLRLNDTVGPTYSSKRIDPYNRYEISFLTKTIPDKGAVFLIRGKRYLCAKLTTKLTSKGISELVKGTFYQLLD